MVEIAPFIPDDAPQHIAFVHQSWPAYPSELAAIRSEVHRWLAPLRLTANTEDDIVYAVNEAATNAVEHAYTPGTAGDTVELTFWTEATALCIDIVDHGKWQTPISPDRTGRGLGIPVMQQLIDSVLIHYDNNGTEVFLRHLLQPASS